MNPTCKGVNQWTRTQWRPCPKRTYCERYLQRDAQAAAHLCPVEGQELPKEFPYFVPGDPND